MKEHASITSLKETLVWLKARRVDAYRDRQSLDSILYRQWTPLSESDRQQLGESRQRCELFDTLIQQHEKRLRDTRRMIADARPERDNEPKGPFIYAVPQPDVLTVKVVENVPVYAEHRLSEQTERQGEALQAWNYRCLNLRRRRSSRRYEGFGGHR